MSLITTLLKCPLHGCKKTILKPVKILKLQFNSFQTVRTELLEKWMKTLEKTGPLIAKLTKTKANYFTNTLSNNIILLI